MHVLFHLVQDKVYLLGSPRPSPTLSRAVAFILQR